MIDWLVCIYRRSMPIASLTSTSLFTIEIIQLNWLVLSMESIIDATCARLILILMSQSFLVIQLQRQVMSCVSSVKLHILLLCETHLLLILLNKLFSTLYILIITQEGFKEWLIGIELLLSTSMNLSLIFSLLHLSLIQPLEHISY